MIGYLWRDQLDATELGHVEELLAVAVAEDAEAGFSTATPAAPGRGAVRHLLVTIAAAGQRGSSALDALPDVPVVAYLRLDTHDGIGDAQLVVRPEFRSHGIATLLAELLDEQPDGGAAVPGLRTLRAWAHGAHPAADRMAQRFGATMEHGVFRTIRLIGGSRPFDAPAVAVTATETAEGTRELVDGHHDVLAPEQRAVLARGRVRLSLASGSDGGAVLVGADLERPATVPACIAIQTDPGSREALRDLLTAALLQVQGEGARVAQLYVDALDEDVVSVSRSLGFEHDQSDYVYLRDIPARKA